MRRTVVIALVAVMVALAGCGATTQGSLPSDSTAESDATLQPTGGSVDETAGTIAFYVSDEPAAIEDFDHLNVTIEKIGLQKKGAEDADDDTEAAEAEDPEEESEEEAEETEEAEDEAENETSEAEDDPEGEGLDQAANGNAGDANESDERDDKDESAGWVTYEVDNRTVDLTELKGENATRLADLTAPNGTYTAVFVYVSEVEGVLENGEEVNVKLPSQKLQLHTTFEVGQNASTDFVYDIAVHKAGNSGKYILKPNIAESGTDVQIRDIDEDDENEQDGEDEKDDEEEKDEEEGMEGEDEDEKVEDMNDEAEADDDETNLSIALEEPASPGKTVSILVNDENESAVTGLNLSVEFGDGYNETVVQTGGDGRVEITIPEDAEKLAIEVADEEDQEEFDGEFEDEFEDD